MDPAHTVLCSHGGAASDLVYFEDQAKLNSYLLKEKICPSKEMPL